ncbi:uncharacterized protein [Physcomitrium patens]|uniref:C2H2-type domain-containing protein n=1 Tax=Physcomitrium patens TaxID=3218 RepID=A0A2K1IVS1_PHYPA|nr:uncharacterized protein LOC112273145 isoform X2 [Physcomitrium patens]PNR33373.1 hypothetical protein PHYPA_025317 [Physcomitrium patens]|eukprot:XP_024357380.1 uncharacterized protein LOC112273145 isoform X2 [Physcomitrella patens]
MNGLKLVLPQVEDSYSYLMKAASQALPWCSGLRSEVAKKWQFMLNKFGTQAEAGCKDTAEIFAEGGVLVVRSQSCPWSSANIHHTNQCIASDASQFYHILENSFYCDTTHADRQDLRCKYCATLENELTNSKEMNKWKWAGESCEDANVKQANRYFEPGTTMPLIDHDNQKQKYGQDEWQNGRALVLLKLKELTMRATQAEQRVHELEQLLRDHALVGLDDTWGDSEMVTSASTYNCLNKRSEMLVCKIAECNKAFKSSKTLRRHVQQKHSDTTRFFMCNQLTVNGEVCHFETIHSGVLSYHRKYSLAHHRREDWHIFCPFCQIKFARQHEMERHRRICKFRPAPSRPSPHSKGSSVQSTVTEMPSESCLNHPLQPWGFVVPDPGHHNHQIFKMFDSKFNIESGIT